MLKLTFDKTRCTKYNASFYYDWTWGWSIWKLDKQAVDYLHQYHPEGKVKAPEEDATEMSISDAV